MPEENEPPGGESGLPPGRREGDLLAERRARRAVEGGEQALIRRAEAAEATLHTLERHVHSLQQRLREAEEENTRLAAAVAEERSSAEPASRSCARPASASTKSCSCAARPSSASSVSSAS